MKKSTEILLGKKNFTIHFDKDREVGGILFGHMYNGKRNGFADVKAILQLRNRSKTNKHYIFPNFIYCFIRSLPFLLKGYSILGEWHSHPHGMLKPSNVDDVMMFNKAKRKFDKIYRLGIVTLAGKMKIYEYDYNSLAVPKVIKA